MRTMSIIKVMTLPRKNQATLKLYDRQSYNIWQMEKLSEKKLGHVSTTNDIEKRLIHCKSENVEIKTSFDRREIV